LDVVYIHCDVLCETYVYPFGNISLSVTHHALLGHALFKIIVNVTLLQTTGVVLLTVLVTDRSAI